MTEPINDPAPEENMQDAARPEGDLRAELARVRNRNNTLKIVAGIFLTLFIIVAAGGYVVYLKIQEAKENFEEVFRSMPMPQPGYQSENRTLPVAQGVSGPGSMPASTMGLLTGGLPDSPGENMDAARSERILGAMNKYADRPIVKEFIADLKRNPDMAEAFASSKGGNPLTVLSKIQGAKGLDKIFLKYATRPEFMKVMVEFMNDPEMKPLMKGMPGGMPMGLGGMGQAVAVPSGPDPRASQPSEEDGDREMTFDPSVISGPAAPAPAVPKKTYKRKPPPVDSD